MKMSRNGWLTGSTDRRVTSFWRICRSARTILIWRKLRRKLLCTSVRRCSEPTPKSFYLFRKSRLLGSKVRGDFAACRNTPERLCLSDAFLFTNEAAPGCQTEAEPQNRTTSDGKQSLTSALLRKPLRSVPAVVRDTVFALIWPVHSRRRRSGFPDAQLSGTRRSDINTGRYDKLTLKRRTNAQGRRWKNRSDF